MFPRKHAHSKQPATIHWQFTSLYIRLGLGTFPQSRQTGQLFDVFPYHTSSFHPSSLPQLRTKIFLLIPLVLYVYYLANACRPKNIYKTTTKTRNVSIVWLTLIIQWDLWLDVKLTWRVRVGQYVLVKTSAFRYMKYHLQTVRYLVVKLFKFYLLYTRNEDDTLTFSHRRFIGLLLSAKLHNRLICSPQ